MAKRDGEKRGVAVVGAGIVGMSVALALAERGFRVTLFDPNAPGSRTSTWNAGVLATSSLVPLCNPGIYRRLPEFALGRYPGFSAHPLALAGQVPWLVRFLSASRASVFARTASALNGLITYSRSCHDALIRRAGCRELLREDGWLHLYRDASSFAKARENVAFYHRHDVKARAVAADELSQLEPGLRPLYAGAVLFAQTTAVTDPALLMQAYQGLLAPSGVEMATVRVRQVVRTQTGHRIIADGVTADFDQVVICAGAWSAELLRPYVKLPMVVERGYLQKFRVRDDVLMRPVFDTAMGLVLSPRPGSIQLSTGTDLTQIRRKPRLAQFRQAERTAREIVDLGEAIMEQPMIGNRPSLPDGMPAIGPLRGHPGLWVAAGHQHIGLSTGPATGQILAAMMEGVAPEIDATPFLPARFGI